mmetsp:Transcript_8331/g.20586  ORF Transcript_8331/g.20586 Transcript_8331/m.20586 type:complete len:660 (+) Transcript_8331:42-2021(+)
MASPFGNENRPKIPGRCDICEMKDGKRAMTFAQCSKCKVCVHKECYMVFPEGDGKHFVCFGCAAVGKTFQAVDSHRSSRFYEIEQKERPTECVLCSVSGGVHAMYPLFDYHGSGGRQICYLKKASNSDGSGHEKGKMVLAWGHALCCLYLSVLNFMYACYKDGDYIGMEEDEDNDPDTRPPNPELKITDEFRRMYGDAMPHFRYYMIPPGGMLDPWTKAVVVNKKELKCIECGLVDDKHSMRIPVQCVANDPDEYFEYKDKHRLRNNDVQPCTQALHVGCARWKDGSSMVRKCYYFPGITNNDGTIKENQDTVHCLYCKNHAENVDENYQKQLKREKALKLQQRQQQRAQPLKGYPKAIGVANSSVRTRVSHTDALLPQSMTKRPISMMSGTNSSSKNKGGSQLFGPPKGSRSWGKYKDVNKERHKELDSSMAVAINSGQQPTLAKRRRELANEMSVVSKGDSEKIFDDLVKHQHEIARHAALGINGRKRFWKHKFSRLSTNDFDSIWNAALDKFQTTKKKVDGKKSNAYIDRSERGLDRSAPVHVDLTSSNSDVDEDSECSKHGTRDEIERGKQNTNNHDNCDFEMATEVKNRSDLELPNDEGIGNVDDGRNDQKFLNGKEKQRKTAERSPDRWSKLFVGQRFKMGFEFTLDEFEEKF